MVYECPHRPILLTTSSTSFLPMQMGKGKVLKILPQVFHFRPVEASEVAEHLQLLALAEGFYIARESLVSLAEVCHGNVSKMLLELQFITEGKK